MLSTVKTELLATIERPAEMLPVFNCERCSGDHGKIPFYWLHNPIVTSRITYNLWTLCPTLNEPFLASTSRDEVEFR